MSRVIRLSGFEQGMQQGGGIRVYLQPAGTRANNKILLSGAENVPCRLNVEQPQSTGFQL